MENMKKYLRNYPDDQEENRSQIQLLKKNNKCTMYLVVENYMQTGDDIIH